MTAHPVSEETFAREVLASERPVIVSFHALWCGPCRLFAPTLEDVVDEHPEVRLVSVNVEKHPALAERYRVYRLPTVLRFERGEEVARVVGGRRRSKLARQLGLSQ